MLAIFLLFDFYLRISDKYFLVEKKLEIQLFHSAKQLVQVVWILGIKFWQLCYHRQYFKRTSFILPCHHLSDWEPMQVSNTFIPVQHNLCILQNAALIRSTSSNTGVIGKMNKNFSQQMFTTNPGSMKLMRFVAAINMTRISLVLPELCIDFCVYL